jgi:hypothetical protein
MDGIMWDGVPCSDFGVWHYKAMWIGGRVPLIDPNDVGPGSCELY